MSELQYLPNQLFSLHMTKTQCRDTGMAFVLILLLLSFFLGKPIFYQIAIPVLILNMTAPRIYYPFAIVWFGLTNVLGSIVSRVLLSFVFFGLVLPVGLLRRLFRKDTLNLRNWKKESASVMNIRNHVFSAKDLEKPY